MFLDASTYHEQSPYRNSGACTATVVPVRSKRPNPVYHSGVGLAGRLLYVCLMITLCLPFL
jgi:hypothetical protein